MIGNEHQERKTNQNNKKAKDWHHLTARTNHKKNRTAKRTRRRERERERGREREREREREEGG
jgi:hypothetical protein